MKKSALSVLLPSLFSAIFLWPTLASASDNIAQGKPVTVSSVEKASLSAEQAVDGNHDTRWSSDFSDHNWISVDLEDRYDLSSITLHWQNSYSKDYDIKVSDDGENWTTIESVVDSDGGVDELELTGRGRYVRIEGYRRATNWGHSLWELEIQGELYVAQAVASDANLALNKTVFASSMENNSLVPEQAVDGDSSTRWSSDYNDHNWITVDLEDHYNLSNINLHWQNSSSKDYDIKVSDDGDNWTTIKSVVDSDGGVDELNVSGQGRYVRIEGYRRATRWGHSLWELEVYGELIEPTVTNVVRDKAVFASSVENAALAPERAIDGNPDTRWSSDFSDHNWITVDLGSEHQLVEAKLYWQNSYSKDYDIKVSDDGENWSTVESVVDSDGGLDELSFSARGRYVRVEGYRRATNWGHSLWEMQVFGYPTGRQAETDTSDETNGGDTGGDGDSGSGSDTGAPGEEPADTSAPTVPGSLNTTVVGSTHATLSWADSSDDEAVISYEVYRDGARVAEMVAPTTDYTDTGLSAGTTYQYSVRASDAAGNWSDFSSTLVVATNTDQVVVDGVVLEWTTPDQRENGHYLELDEIGGYEIRYQQGSEGERQSIVVEDAYATSHTLTLDEGVYEFTIAVFDVNGLYSRFVPIEPVQ